MLVNKLQALIKKILRIRYCTIGSSSLIAYPNRIMNPSKNKSKIIIGDNCIIKCEIQILGHGGNVMIGDYCFIGDNSYIWSGKSIKIGNRVLIGHNCNIFDNDIHPFDKDERHEQFKNILLSGHPKNIKLNDAEVRIEDDVWIGANVTIMKGVKVGNGAIIGAGSVITKDVEPFTVNAGNPAKILRRLNEKQTTKTC